MQPYSAPSKPSDEAIRRLLSICPLPFVGQTHHEALYFTSPFGRSAVGSRLPSTGMLEIFETCKRVLTYYS